MTFSELIVEVARNSGVRRADVAAVLYSFIRVTTRALASGSEVRLRQFGVFHTVKQEERDLFGGSRKTMELKVRFKETRRGKARRTDQ